MEWLIVAVCALIAAALIALPAGPDAASGEPPHEALREERRLLLAELREIDEDASAGRIAAQDRNAGRRALAPRLRAVTEALRAAGEGDTGTSGEPPA